MPTPASSCNVDLHSISCPNIPGCRAADYDQSVLFGCRTFPAVQERGAEPLLSVLSDPLSRGSMPIRRADHELRKLCAHFVHCADPSKTAYRIGSSGMGR